MKRSFAFIVLALLAGALFAGLVHGVLVATHLSEPADVTVYGLTARRLWATTALILALFGVVIGWVAMTRPVRRSGTAILAVGVGLIATVNGALNLTLATGGPGTGNGVVGGAAALLLGLIAVAIGGVALARGRRIDLGAGRAT